MSKETLTSPCPHQPPCPPPVCLPQTLRAPAKPVPSPGEGYETEIGYIEGFAGTMGDTAESVRQVSQRTPRFAGWNLVPLAGVPVIGLAFVNRLNTIADTWIDSAGILDDLLRTDSARIARSAANYRQAEHG